jgi:putative Mg2+ transporter-C (MgtC) family protein
MTWQEITLRLGMALLLGGAVGLERQWKSHYVGLRTNSLIAIGSAALMIFGFMLPAGDPGGLARIASQIITSIGFLCAGVIMHEGMTVKGFNTAATLWCSVTVGIFAGSGFFVPAAILAALIILVNLFFHPLVNYINKTTVPEETESYSDRAGK